MESWKFLVLIERAGEALCLHEYVKTRVRDPAPQFIFNNNRAGQVVGKFDPKTAFLEVLCLTDGNGACTDRATFMLDSTYTLCLYTTLRRLRDDKERFIRLREQAQTLVAVKDPFENVYQPLTAKES